MTVLSVVSLSFHCKAFQFEEEFALKPEKCYKVCQQGGCFYEDCEDAQCPGGACTFSKCLRPTCTGNDAVDNSNVYLFNHMLF